MKNKLLDLNNHLFAQLERLSDEDVKGEALKEEIQRGHAVSQVAAQITRGADLQLKAARLIAEHGDRHARSLPMIEHDGNG